MTAVAFKVSCEVAFDYLADPANRSEWQSSLSGVADISGEVAVGQSWVDETKAGVRPRMETTELDRPHLWSERGTWRGFSALLTLTFEPVGEGCAVTPTMGVTGRGVARVPAVVLNRLAPRAVRSDLRRAAAVLAAR